MAAKKWTKWVVGLSSVISFTGFMYLTQGPADSGVWLDEVGVEPSQANSSARLETSASLQSQTKAFSKKTDDRTATGGHALAVAMFVHSRAEFQQVTALPQEAKSERELQLEQLNWDELPGDVVVLEPIKAITPAAKSQSTIAVTPAKPNETTSIKRSDRRTRRS